MLGLGVCSWLQTRSNTYEVRTAIFELYGVCCGSTDPNSNARRLKKKKKKEKQIDAAHWTVEVIEHDLQV